MTSVLSQKPVLRFAPSPNGLLHLGHALSALLNQKLAREHGGQMLLRIEDIDRSRCTPEFEAATYRDLRWIGFDWQGSVRRQSQHVDLYRQSLDRLNAMGLIYPAFMTRGEIKAKVAVAQAEGHLWPCDPDGAPLYPPDDKNRTEAQRQALLGSGRAHAWRLDMEKALRLAGHTLSWQETGDGERGVIFADPAAWGDVILSRSDAPSSYHLSVVIDDAAQGVSHVVRGLDLFHATAVHRLLQVLLDLPGPIYHHHRLILGSDGRKLSKSEGATGLAALREAGHSAFDIRGLLGL